MTKIASYQITRFAFKRDRIIGDAQVKSEWHYIGALELISDSGLTGTGFFISLFSPLPDLKTMNHLFETGFFAGLKDKSPFELIHRVSRPRGGNRSPHTAIDLGGAVNTALWDMAAKSVDLPLYKFLGGTNPEVPAYASLLEFHLSDDEVTHYLRQIKDLGYTAYKIKVGHPDPAWDLNRLKLVQSIVGEDARLMVDANESWSPREAIRRTRLFQREGIDIFWLEDPILREDIEGLRLIKNTLPDVHLNTGEYMSTSGKRELLEAGVVDILNIHGHLSDGLRIGWRAAEAGIPVSLGNTMFEIGVHLAAALPECIAVEYAFHNFRHLIEKPIAFSRGVAIAPDRPGHGIVIDEDARQRWACPDEFIAEIEPHPDLKPYTG